MIKNYLITGDTHGKVMERINNIPTHYSLDETALIILGDTGINYHLNRTDAKLKEKIMESGIKLYCVRGNHEESPCRMSTMELQYDPEVKNKVWVENEFPHIRYFEDGELYEIAGHSVLVIGGAYSPDMEYRLTRGMPWFPFEQLTAGQMAKITKDYSGKEVDFILSHTFPLSWSPEDLFLPYFDQSKIDKTMEKWMDDLKDKVKWKIWLGGHYHDDRFVRPHVQMLYVSIQNIEKIWQRWTGEEKPEWYLKKDPHYYLDDNYYWEEAIKNSIF